MLPNCCHNDSGTLRVAASACLITILSAQVAEFRRCHLFRLNGPWYYESWGYP